MAKTPKKTETAAREADEEELAPAPEKEAPTPAKTAAGDNITVAGREYPVKERRAFRASPKAGIRDGVYPVVIEEARDGKRTYKAAVEGLLYTIKNYGRPDEVIMKLRDPKGPSTRRTTASDGAASETFEFGLDDEVIELLASYKSLEHKLDPEAWLNNQLRKILTGEIARLEQLHAGMKKIPQDLLAQLAGADEAKLAKIRSLLGT